MSEQSILLKRRFDLTRSANISSRTFDRRWPSTQIGTQIILFGESRNEKWNVTEKELPLKDNDSQSGGSAAIGRTWFVPFDSIIIVVVIMTAVAYSD